MAVAPSPFEDTSEASPPKRPDPWRAKFGHALRGLKFGIRGHSSFAVHFFFAALVFVAAIVLECNPMEWCILLMCIGGVLTAELFNSAIETLFRGLDESMKPRCWQALDIAAGAVLAASITAAAVGSFIFLSRFWRLFFAPPPA